MIPDHCSQQVDTSALNDRPEAVVDYSMTPACRWLPARVPPASRPAAPPRLPPSPTARPCGRPVRAPPHHRCSATTDHAEVLKGSSPPMHTVYDMQQCKAKTSCSHTTCRRLLKYHSALLDFPLWIAARRTCRRWPPPGRGSRAGGAPPPRPQPPAAAPGPPALRAPAPAACRQARALLVVEPCQVVTAQRFACAMVADMHVMTPHKCSD